MANQAEDKTKPNTSPDATPPVPGPRPDARNRVVMDPRKDSANDMFDALMRLREKAKQEKK